MIFTDHVQKYQAFSDEGVINGSKSCTERWIIGLFSWHQAVTTNSYKAVKQNDMQK